MSKRIKHTIRVIDFPHGIQPGAQTDGELLAEMLYPELAAAAGAEAALDKQYTAMFGEAEAVFVPATESQEAMLAEYLSLQARMDALKEKLGVA